MRKKNKKQNNDINYLDLIPERNEALGWHKDLKERVILEVENTGIMNTIAQKVFSKPRFTKVHLDRQGSFIWPLIDGKRTVADIAALVKEEFGEAAEPLYPRIVKYFQIVESYRFVKFVVTYCIVFWENPKGSNTVGIINQATQAGWLPELFGQKYGWNLLIVLVLTVVMFIYLKYSKQGYEIAVVGESENTARYAGIHVKRVIIRTMAISGAICGIAGFVIVSGASHTISTMTADGRGFTAIIVAWLSKFNTFIMLAVSFGIVFMQQGAVQIASQYGLNENASDVILGIILFFLIGAEFFINYKLERTKK